METLQSLKRGDIQLLIASDVASRGLDISALATVVSYELARDVDSHVHRIGRTGRQGIASYYHHHHYHQHYHHHHHHLNRLQDKQPQALPIHF